MQIQMLYDVLLSSWGRSSAVNIWKTMFYVHAISLEQIQQLTWDRNMSHDLSKDGPIRRASGLT